MICVYLFPFDRSTALPVCICKGGGAYKMLHHNRPISPSQVDISVISSNLLQRFSLYGVVDNSLLNGPIWIILCWMDQFGYSIIWQALLKVYTHYLWGCWYYRLGAVRLSYWNNFFANQPCSKILKSCFHKLACIDVWFKIPLPLNLIDCHHLPW